MPKADFGQKILTGESQFLRLKAKGDKAHIRFAASAIYEGKHFIEHEDGTTTVEFCPRIMGSLPCEICKHYFELAKEIKAEKNEDKKKALEKKARAFRAAISFYYPVLDRQDGKSKILQTTMSVRTLLEAELEAGVNVLEADYILTRTEATPATYYTLVRLDSKDTKDLSKEEKVEYEKAAALDVEEALGHKGKESGLDLEAK